MSNTKLLPANRPRNVLRRLERARRFPDNTCPASRHVEHMARALLTQRGYPMLAQEPEHCAGSMLAVLESLWKLRTRAQQRQAVLRRLFQVCTDMDLDNQLERPTEAEYQSAMAAARAAVDADARASK